MIPWYKYAFGPLIKILTFNDSRKVGVGAWLFIFTNVYVSLGIIKAPDWIWGMGFSTALIGGGTIADRLMKDKKEREHVVPDTYNPQA